MNNSSGFVPSGRLGMGPPRMEIRPPPFMGIVRPVL
jgi:hypothetical protein